MAWQVELLNKTVSNEFRQLPVDLRAQLVRISELIVEHGLPNVGMPHVRQVQDKLWEIRIKGKDNIARALYVTAYKERVVILRIFIKKTQQTPLQEIELALKRAQEVKEDD